MGTKYKLYLLLLSFGTSLKIMSIFPHFLKKMRPLFFVFDLQALEICKKNPPEFPKKVQMIKCLHCTIILNHFTHFSGERIYDFCCFCNNCQSETPHTQSLSESL